MNKAMFGIFAGVLLAAVVTSFALPRGSSIALALMAEPSPVVSVTTLPALPLPAATRPHATAVPTAMPLGSPAVYPTTAPSSTPLPAPSVVPAPPGSFIEITGAVGVPMVLTLRELQKFKRTSLALRVVDADGRHRFHTFTGAPLHDVIEQAQPRDAGGVSTSRRAYALVSGLAGGPAIVAFPEFEPDYSGNTVLLAYIVDGHAPDQGIAELAIQGDATRGRFVTGVTRIVVVDPGP